MSGPDGLCAGAAVSERGSGTWAHFIPIATGPGPGPGLERAGQLEGQHVVRRKNKVPHFLLTCLGTLTRQRPDSNEPRSDLMANAACDGDKWRWRWVEDHGGSSVQSWPSGNSRLGSRHGRAQKSFLSHTSAHKLCRTADVWIWECPKLDNPLVWKDWAFVPGSLDPVRDGDAGMYAGHGGQRTCVAIVSRLQ